MEGTIKRLNDRRKIKNYTTKEVAYLMVLSSVCGFIIGFFSKGALWTIR